MPIEVVALGTLDGVSVGAPPVAGVLWDRGTLLRLEGARIAWSLPLADEPLLAVAGRRLYVAAGALLVCLDLRTGAEAWAEECDAPITALAERSDGVDVVAGPTIHAFDVYGRPQANLLLDQACTALLSLGATRYAAGPAGIWRLAAGERPAFVARLDGRALVRRDGGVQALAEGPGGTVLVEDEGLPLVWPFPAAASHWMAPWGRVEWAVAPREGRGGVWVVDRRVQTRWQVPLPGVARGLAVTGRAVSVLIDDAGTALAVTHPDVSTPLLLAVDGATALHGDGSVLYLTHGEGTTMFLVREA